MFSDDTLEKYAEVMLWGLQRGRTKKFNKSDFITINYGIDGLPLAEELCSQIYDLGFIPIPRAMPTPKMERALYTKANNKRLMTLAPGERDLANHLHGNITIFAPASLTHLADIESERLTMRQKSMQPLQAIRQTREEMGMYGWTLCMYPTQALAAQAGMTVEEYAREIERSCYLTAADPVREWRMLVKQSEEIRNWLDSFGDATLHVESDSIDLRLNVGRQRKWAGVTGRNIPSFEVYVSPDWRTVEGTYHADLSSYRSGHIVENVRLEFADGRVTDMSADKSMEFVTEQMNLDPGAVKVGEFALVDKRFSPIRKFMANTLYDENHGGENGSMHIALGNSYANTFAGDPSTYTEDTRRELGFNTSILHWDLINTTPKRVTASLPEGKKLTIYENGQFTL